MLLKHAGVSFMHNLSTHPRHLLRHFLPCMCVRSNTATLLFCALQKLNVTHPPKKQLWFLAPKCNPLLLWIACSYQLLQDGELSIQQPQRKKTIPSPLASRIKAPHLRTDPALVRQQLKPQCSGEGVGTHRPQIYKLDFYPFTSCSLPSTLQLRRRQLCGLGSRCNYHHLCLETRHIWQKRIQLRYLWSLPLMNELPPKRLQMCSVEFNF